MSTNPYLFIETRDPFESAGSDAFISLVRGVRESGHPTTLFLVQNGVLPARAGARYAERYASLSGAGVRVLADGFSLRERAIGGLAPGIQPAEIGTLVDLLLEPGTKAIWH